MIDAVILGMHAKQIIQNSSKRRTRAEKFILSEFL
jgi:hypothetical protein